MSLRFTCPGCQARLLLPDEFSGPAFTCPRCLTQMPNPGSSQAAKQETTETTSAALPSRPKVDAPSRSPTWQFNIQFGTGKGWSADEDAAGDLKGTGLILVLLAGLSLLGVLVTFLLIENADYSTSTFLWQRVLPGCLVVLFVCGVLLVLTQEHPLARKVGWGIMQLFLGIIVLVIAIGAFLALVAMVCSAILGSGKH